MRNMKTFLLITLALVSFGIAGISQQQFAFTGGKDSLVNTDTSYASAIVPGNVTSAAIQLTVSNHSGTLAGKAYLQGSVDGTNYIVVDSTTFVAGASYTKVWTPTAFPYLRYRIQAIASGTQVSYLAAPAYFRRAVYTNLK
jgi:hypothetical protein